MHEGAQANAGHTALYESNFYQSLLSEVRIPSVHQQFRPQDIFNFLRSIASDYISKIQESTSAVFCKKLEHNFYIICMLNALFGDPRLHLV